MQETCIRSLRSMDDGLDLKGAIPAQGLVVANHLSYLDIVILSAAMRCFFVAKVEISKWPYFGKAARVGGTMFIDRSSMSSAEEVAETMSERLKLPVPVLFFPEGTSTDGTLLRFHTRLFEPAIVSGCPVTAVSTRYVMSDSRPERELCWFGNDRFLSHLWNTLKTGGFRAELCFGEPRVYTHRRSAAAETFAEINAMRRGGLEERAEALRRLAPATCCQSAAEGGAVDPRTTRLVDTKNSC